ncbi:hypothetical protein HMPREF6123_0020 [Oribacterium sinus F0268]|uniref:Uncharacterized protein n=1 Tax=Oribacterium sinus F0268 TaxID=585501 RepID=C2KU51_9FIRM|nr:hypothetical protein HMPREF6123_0020 [Oribacterium sinus F0268]
MLRGIEPEICFCRFQTVVIIKALDTGILFYKLIKPDKIAEE